MLTNARVDTRVLAELYALMFTFDWAKPTSESGDDIKAKLIELSNSWHIRAFLAQHKILQEPPTGSRLLKAGSFLDPLEDTLSKRLKQMNAGVGGDFFASLVFQMDNSLFARVYALDKRAYSIEIGLVLMVQLFLGAITLSQPGSESSSHFPNPFQCHYGEGAASVYAVRSSQLLDVCG
jgi:hypothetical protein